MTVTPVRNGRGIAQILDKLHPLGPLLTERKELFELIDQDAVARLLWLARQRESHLQVQRPFIGLHMVQ